MKRITFILLALLTCSLGTSVRAQEPGIKKWRDEAELAFVDTTGNTEIVTIAIKNTLKYKFTPRLAGDWQITALKGQTDGETTAERYSTDVRIDYTMTDQRYSFVLGGWLKDRFAGIDQRYNLGPGLGYRFISGPKHFLRAEAGLNYTHEDYVVAGSKDFLEARTFGRYEYAFSAKNRFLLSAEYLQDCDESQNFKVNAETAVIAGLIDVLALKIGYEVRYQNRPLPADLEKTDTILSASFILTY